MSVGVSTLGEDAPGGRIRPGYVDQVSIDKGDKAPDFSLPDQDGNTVSLAAGIEAKKWQVVYFYPAG